MQVQEMPQSKRIDKLPDGGYYIGTTGPGGYEETDKTRWSICHIAPNGDTTWAIGGFSKAVWDDRATYTYR